MTSLTKTLAGTLLATCALGAGPALADDDYEAWPGSVYGMSLTVGGGVQDFTDDTVRDTTDPGALWDVRGVLGTRTPIGVEAAYVGSAQAIDARFGEDASATLIGTGFEGALRVNLLPYLEVTPYAFAGLGWKRYDVRGADFRTADTGIDDEDTLLEVPMGGGFAYRYAGFLADARFTYRAAAGEDLVVSDDQLPEEAEPDMAGLDNWSISARAGWEF
jgi:hypothetical protein